MKKYSIIVMSLAAGLLIGTGIGSSMIPTTVKSVHTFNNVAIYYTADSGYIIDEDGRRFEVGFKGLPDQAVIEVTYDNRGTVSRLDDKPISYVLLDETLEARR